MNKYNVHFKGRSRISTDSFNKINVSTLQLNFANVPNQTIYHFLEIFVEFSLAIWGVIMNLTEITYSKNFENMATVLFYRQKNKNSPAEIVEDLC